MEWARFPGMRTKQHDFIGSDSHYPAVALFAPAILMNFARGSKDYFFVILSVAKNLSFKAAEIRNEAALRSE
jgi:hypothetical protein